jgi:hypothetical protein
LLLQKGFSAGSVALIAAGVTAIAAIVGRIAMDASTCAALALIVGFFAALVGAGVWLGSLKLHAAVDSQHESVNAAAPSLR